MQMRCTQTWRQWPVKADAFGSTGGMQEDSFEGSRRVMTRTVEACPSCRYTNSCKHLSMPIHIHRALRRWTAHIGRNEAEVQGLACAATLRPRVPAIPSPYGEFTGLPFQRRYAERVKHRRRLEEAIMRAELAYVGDPSATWVICLGVSNRNIPGGRNRRVLKGHGRRPELTTVGSPSTLLLGVVAPAMNAKHPIHRREAKLIWILLY